MRVKSGALRLAVCVAIVCAATSVDAQLGGLKKLGTKIKDGAVGGVTGVVKGARGKDSSEKGAPSAPAELAARDSCKPDISRVDKISKEKVEAYSQPLFATSFMGSMWKAQETYITMLFVHSGNNYGIELVVQKKEGSEERAVFESQYRAAVGRPIQLGFKDGKPLEIMVTDVRNNSQMTGFLSDSKRVTTTVTLAAELRDDDLPRVREALTTGQVDAVRVQLAGGVEISKSVDDKLGRQLMQKAGCFFEGVVLPTASVGGGGAVASGVNVAGGESTSQRDYVSSAPGKYLFKKGRARAGDYVELEPGGRFFSQENGRSFAGTYTVKGDVLTLLLSTGQAARAKFSGDTIVDSDGIVWEKPADAPKPPAAALTIDQIIQMVDAKLPDDLIITTIRNSGSKFDLNPDVLIRLKTAGVSDTVLRAMSK